MGIRNPPRAAPQPLRRGGVLPRPPATRRPSHYASVGSASSTTRRIHCLLSVGRHPCVPPPATLRPSRYASVGVGVLDDPQAALFGRKSRRNFCRLHSYLFAAMWMLRCDKRGLSPEKISNTVTFRRSSAAAQGDAGPSAGGSSLFWRAFFRAHRPCDPGSQKGESKLLWQKN